jgi:hypothetical protein
MTPPRVRFTVRRMVTLIVFAALVSALVTQSVRLVRHDRELARLEALLADHRRAADRRRWAERMHEKGYLSWARVVSEDLSLKWAAGALGLPD